MKRYYLLFEHQFSKEIEDSLLFFLKKKGQNLEDLKSRQNPIKSLGVQATDDIDEISNLVESVYVFEVIPIIILIDTYEDFIFIYKAEGTLESIKTKVLPIILDTFRLIVSDDLTFFEIRDIRDAMKLGIYLKPSIN